MIYIIGIIMFILGMMLGSFITLRLSTRAVRELIKDRTENYLNNRNYNR